MTETIDSAGIAQLLGVSRKHVTQRVVTRPDFPRPTIDVSQKTRRWAEADVREWARPADQQSRRA